jgi:hypothetical protein
VEGPPFLKTSLPCLAGGRRHKRRKVYGLQSPTLPSNSSPGQAGVRSERGGRMVESGHKETGNLAQFLAAQ